MEFACHTSGASNLADGVVLLPHKASRIVDHLRRRGAIVLTQSHPWGPATCDAAILQWPHKSAYNNAEGLCIRGDLGLLSSARILGSVSIRERETLDESTRLTTGG